jgi:hypothetical protein
MAWDWNPPISEVKKKPIYDWQLSEEEKVQPAYDWQPPEVVVPKPIVKVPPTNEEQVGVFTDEVNRKKLTTYDEPTWGEVALHSQIAGLGDVQSSLLSLGKLLYEAGVQITDKVTDVFGKDIYDPKKDAIRNWLGEQVTKSEQVSADSWEKIVSKNRLKNFVALGGRAVPLTFLTLMSGGMLANAFPILPAAIGERAAQMIPFALTTTGEHAKEIEEEYKARGKEVPYLPLLLGSLAVGGIAETASEAIPFGAILNTFGGSAIINRGAGSLLKIYGPAVVQWLTGITTETLQEVAMVPIEKSVNNLLFSEDEPLLPIPELIQAGAGGLAMSLIMGGLGSTSSAIRSFTETKVDKMMKLDITRKEGIYDIAEKIIDESKPPVELPQVEIKTGQPYTATVYRGTRKGITPVDEGLYGKGASFTTNEEVAKTYGEVKTSVVNLKNPFVINTQEEADAFWNEVTRPARDKAIKEGKTPKEANEIAAIAARKFLEGKGFDGVVARNIVAEGDEVVAFRPIPEGVNVDKELLKIEIEKARVCDKFGLDSKDFKFVELPKGDMEVLPPDEIVDEQLKELQDAGYGIEKELEEEPSAERLVRTGKVDEGKSNVHIMTKDEVVKRLMRAHELGAGYQEVAEVIEEGLDKEVPAQPTPLGTRLSSRIQMFFKSMRSSMVINPQVKNLDMALDGMYGTIAENAYLADQTRDTWEKMVPDKTDEVIIDKYLDMPEKYQDEITKRGLQGEADWLKRQYARLGDVALSTDTIRGLWDNYTPRIYKNINEYLKRNQNDRTNIPVSNFLGARFAHGMERRLATYDDAEALGLVPEYRAGLKLGEYMYSLAKVVAHKNFIDTVKEMTDEDGHPVAVHMNAREDWAKNYKMVNTPSFATYTVVREEGSPLLTKVPLRWKPEVAAAIEEIGTPPYTQSKYARSIRSLKGIVKRLIFLNPAIHGWNIYSNVLDEVNFNFFEAYNAIKPGGKGAQMYLNQPKLVREALKNGLEYGRTGEIAGRLRGEIYGLLPIEGKNIITKNIGKLAEWSDNILWNTIVRDAQIYTYALKRKQGLTPKQAAVFTNDLMGTLSKRTFTNAEWVVTSSFLLARNWTVSNLRLLTGAMGSISNIIPGKMLTRKGMTNADLQALAPHYIRHLVKGIFGLFIMTNILNKLLTDKWALENEPGHKLDLNIGMKDSKGRDMYVVLPVLRYIRDYLGWATEPQRTLWNKAEPVMKTSLELLVNHSVWQNKQIMKPGAPTIDRVKAAAEYAFESWTPFDQFLDTDNEVKTTLQRLMFFTGTWVRRGSSASATVFNTLRMEDKVEFLRTLNPKQVNELYGQLAIGRIYGEVAKKLYDFRNKMDYAKEKIDADIDKLLTGGDFPEAIQLMIESKRYTDIGAIRDRILPYVMLSK